MRATRSVASPSTRHFPSYLCAVNFRHSGFGLMSLEIDHPEILDCEININSNLTKYEVVVRLS